MIRGSRDFLKKNSGVPNFCACVAKPIATTERVTKTKSVARDPMKERQPTEEFEQRNIALQPTNRQKRYCHISTQNVL